ncbi:MAG: RND family transporter [Bacteroidetes bacterium]|nr:RND family transporter [Bacteroidota bacterium]
MNTFLKYRFHLLIVVFLLTGVFGYHLTHLTINFSFESFYPKNDPEFKYYNWFQETFDDEQNYVIYVALKSAGEDIYDATFLADADSIFSQIHQITGVDSVVSALSMNQIRRTGLSFRQRPYLDYSSESALSGSRERNEEDPALIGTLITEDFQYICAYIITNSEIFDKEARDVFADELDAILVNSPYEYFVSGVPYIRTGYVRKLKSELAIFVSLATLLILSVLFFTYRNIWGVIIPVFAVNASMIWILGFMAFNGQSVNLITELLVPIMFVVGMSDIIHLITKYLQEVRKGSAPEQAIRDTLREIGLAILLTSITTAVGFASLLISNVPPIREFGFYAAIGVIFTFLISIIVIPNALLWLKPERFMQAKAVENHPFWEKLMEKLYVLTIRRSTVIIRLSVLIVVACIVLIFKIPLETFLIEDIGKNDPIRTSMEFFEKKSSGLRPFDIGIHVAEGHNALDQDVLAEIEKIQAFLDSQGFFGPFISPVTIVQEANYLYNYSRPRYRKIPEDQEAIDELLAYGSMNGLDKLMRRVVSADSTVTRISSRVPDLGSKVFEQFYEELDQFVTQNCNTQLFSYRLTGHAYVTENNLDYLRRSLMGGLGLAFVVIALIIGFLFRSWKMLLISMIPNVIPLILTGGVMGLFGIHLTASTALVFVIAFGIAVDDTIHFLTRFRLEIQQGQPMETAILNTLKGTGKAMILTSLVLLGGFVILLVSDFGGTFNTGLFSGLTILFALIGDLVVLPVLVRMIWRG